MLARVQRRMAEEELAQKAKELALANAELENLSLVDDLTGLYNRKGFLALAHHRVKLAQRTGEPFFVAFVDMDDLKQINDTFGHQAGNCALVDAATVLKQCFRDSDILARLGGDEFAAFIAAFTTGWAKQAQVQNTPSAARNTPGIAFRTITFRSKPSERTANFGKRQ